jgi:copper chaperone CopZ
MPTQKLWIQGLKHEDEQHVARSIQALPGVYYAVFNHADSCAEIDFEDDTVSIDEICAALRSLGYVVRVAG